MRESQPHGRVRNRFENATWHDGLERLLHEDRFLSGWSNSVQIAMFRAVHEFTRMHVQVKVLRSESAYHAVGSWW